MVIRGPWRVSDRTSDGGYVMRNFRALVRAAVPAGLCAVVIGAGLTAVTPEPPRVTVTPAPGSTTHGAPIVQRVGSGLSTALPTLGTTTPGYSLATRGLLGLTPRGLHVWVHPKAGHRANLVRHAKATVAYWRNLGLHARYEGLGTPRLREGVVTLTEGSTGCKAGTARVGNTWQSWRSLPGGKAYIYGARIVICPRLYRYARWQWSATVRHELGHAAGLGHFDRYYRGSTQVMRWANKSPVASFKGGDRNGLRYFAGNKTLVRSLLPPRGKVSGGTYLNGTVTITGWAKLDWYPGKAVKIVVTKSGVVVGTTLTNTRDRFVAKAPRLGGTEKYCVTAVSPVRAAARRSLGCVTFS
jgi:hypothetical protein